MVIHVGILLLRNQNSCDDTQCQDIFILPLEVQQITNEATSSFLTLLHSPSALNSPKVLFEIHYPDFIASKKPQFVQSTFCMFSTCLLTTRCGKDSVWFKWFIFRAPAIFQCKLLSFSVFQCTTNLHCIGLYHLSAAASVCHKFVHMQFSNVFFTSTHRKRWR